MNIDRHNYEEYFILYMDNELGSDDRRQVEKFVQKHPDLKEELDVLLQYKMTPDTNIVFDGKEELMVHNGSPISLANYEEWLTGYIDNELTPKQKTEVEQFLAANAQIKKEFEILRQTKLQPEEIIFTDKGSLYRREEKVRIISMRWWRIATAAVLLFGISTTAILVFNNKTDKVQRGVSKSESIKEKSSNNNTVTQSGNKPSIGEQEIQNTDEKKNKIQIKEKLNVIAKQNKMASKNKNEQPSQVKKSEPVLVSNDNEKKKTNDLPQPVDNPYANGQFDPNKVKDAIVKVIPEELTNPGKKTDGGIVTVANPEPSDLIEQPTAKKGKLRGFLRKVTRTFEKNTNINATDDEDRVLIGGLALKLK